MRDAPADTDQGDCSLNLDAVRASLEEAASVLAEMAAVTGREPEPSLSSR